MMANSWRKTGKGGERGALSYSPGRSRLGGTATPVWGFAMFTSPSVGACDPGFAKYDGAPFANFEESLQPLVGIPK